MEIFEFTSVRSYLEALVESRREEWGFKGRLAKAAGCQQSFLSQVLAGQGGLSADHAVGMGEHLHFTEEQMEHWLDLVSLERASHAGLKKLLNRRIKNRRSRHEHLGQRFQAPETPIDHQSVYYSTWYYPALHILCGIKEYQKVSSLSKKLSIPESVVENALKVLASLGIVEHKEGVWKNTKASLHLPRESPMLASYHANWRQQANLDLQMGNTESLHYTALQSISRKDLAKFKNLLIKMIEDSRELVGQSGKEEVLCLSCDLFAVGN